VKKAMIALAALSFFHFEDVKCGMFGFFGDARELPADSEIIQTRADKSNFLKTSDFDAIYKNLPETGTTARGFAFSTANPESQKMFRSHFERIKLINCRDLYKDKPSDQLKCTPELFSTELYSGPAALKLAQSGKKVAVLIFADSTNVGGIYLTKGGNPAGTQEEQTVLMAPEIYGYLGNNFGVRDIGEDGDGIYSAKQKRYCLNKDDYENSEVINPAYGFILTNLLITHDVSNYSKMIKLPKDKVVEVSYAFFSMPSFATDISKDPTGAMLINESKEKDGEKIYDRMREALYILRGDKGICSPQMIRDIGKIAIFYPKEKLRNFSKQHLGRNLSMSEIIAEIVMIKSEQSEESEKVKSIFEEAQKNYEKCVFGKFVNLIRGAEIARADTLVLGKIGCGAFLNDENEIAEIMGKALAECRSIKHVQFAGLNKTDPFVEKVKIAMNKNTLN
jgi:hypothetical protein